MRAQARAAARRLATAVAALVREPAAPHDPRRLTQRHVDRLVRRRVGPWAVLDTFLEACVFDRDDYTCRYCRRAADAVWRASGHRRTLYLEADHLQPKATGGKSFALRNRVTACLRCNAMKGSLPERLFLEELASIAASVCAHSETGTTAAG